MSLIRPSSSSVATLERRRLDVKSKSLDKVRTRLDCGIDEARGQSQENDVVAFEPCRILCYGHVQSSFVDAVCGESGFPDGKGGVEICEACADGYHLGGRGGRSFLEKRKEYVCGVNGSENIDFEL